MDRRSDASLNRRLAAAFAASGVLHLLIAFVLGVLVDFEVTIGEPGQSRARDRRIEVVDSDTAKKMLKKKADAAKRALAKTRKKKKKEEEKKADKAPGQVVHIPPPPREERPIDAKKLSEYDSTVDKETVARNKDVPTPRVKKAKRELISTGTDEKGDTKKRERVPKRKEVATGATGPGDKRTQSDKPGPDNPGDPAERKLALRDTAKLPEGGGVFRRTPDNPAPSAHTPGGGGKVGGAPEPATVRDALPTLGYQELARTDGSPDHLPDIEEGDATFLNTREWKHAWFFNRVKASVQRRWRAVDRHRRHDPYGRVFGVRDRLTVLNVTINADGSLEDVYVVKDSGVAFLDEAAVQAFREAQPFTNPPLALQDSDGNIRFKFGFYLEIHGRGGFRGGFLR